MVSLRVFLAALVWLGLTGSAVHAQKPGGTLRIYHIANPPSLSIHEEATISTVMPMMAVFNNLVLFDLRKPQNSLDTIVPELAESWAWDAGRTKLTFKLRSGVVWHDGRLFTAKDVQCTWNRLSGKDAGYFRKNPRLVWYDNLEDVTVEGDATATFHLRRPQPSFLALLASGYSPVYPCHLAAKDMRTQPVGTGPFKFVSYAANVSISLARNPNYWRSGRPYADAIDWRITPNRSTRQLAFIAGEFDMTFVSDVTVPLLKDVTAQAPKATCALVPSNVSVNVLVNSEKPPFDNPKLRRAMALALDRQAIVDVITGGKATVSAAMMPPPQGLWGLPPEELGKLLGYSGSQEERQTEARRIMEDLGYGPAKRLAIKVATREFQSYREPAVLIVDQLNKIYFDADLEVIESAVWFARMGRGDFAVGANNTGAAIDDPDVMLKENFACKSELNFSRYCNADVDKLLAAQSEEVDVEKRKQLVWQIERKLIEDVARPMIYHNRAATCWHAHLKGFARHENSIYNNWRFDDVWLDK